MHTNNHEQDAAHLLEKIESLATTYSEAYEGMRVDVVEELDYQGSTSQQKTWMWEHNDDPAPTRKSDYNLTRIVCNNTLFKQKP